MRLSPICTYKQTEKEIPIWKQKLKAIESEERRIDELMKDCLHHAYNYSIQLEKLQNEKDAILSEKRQRNLWN